MLRIIPKCKNHHSSLIPAFTGPSQRVSGISDSQHFCLKWRNKVPVILKSITSLVFPTFYCEPSQHQSQPLTSASLHASFPRIKCFFWQIIASQQKDQSNILLYNMGAVAQGISLDPHSLNLPVNPLETREFSYENIQNEQPSPLSNRINYQFKQPIIASKNIMNTSKSPCVPTKNSKDTSQPSTKENPFDLKQLSDKFAEEVMQPVFKVLGRIKVKRPAFEMIQIDHKRFLRMKETPITQDYDIQQEIGKGGFGAVFRATDKKTSQVRAVKKISKSLLNEQQKSNLVNEFEILSSLDHPNIIKLYDIYSDTNHLYVVTQLCEGGDLLHYVNSNKMTEKVMKNIMIQLFSAVSYMHSFRIFHRDIKLENIVLVRKVVNDKQKIEIKLIDFGISLNLQKVKNAEEMDPIGTLLYMAPETLQCKVGVAADVWSCGIALYMMAARKLPYNFKNDSELVQSIKKGRIVRNHLQKLSLDLKVIIMQLLEMNPAHRITAGKALENSWFKKDFHRSSMTVSTRLQAAKNLLDYDAKNNLVSIIEAYLIYKKVNQAQRQRLATIFQEIDQDKSGIIEIQQLKKFYSENSEHYNAHDVEQLLGVMDKNKSGKIDFNEFITGMCNRRELFQLQALQQAFDYFDKDRSGEISKKELEGILEGVQNEEIEYLFDQMDKNHDFKISKKEFLAYLNKYS